MDEYMNFAPDQGKDADSMSLPTATLQDQRLSYLARGILAELLSYPDGAATIDVVWQRAKRHRPGRSKGEGRQAIRGAFSELGCPGRHADR